MDAKQKGQPYCITFCGVNGVGKSTNLSKVNLVEISLRIVMLLDETVLNISRLTFAHHLVNRCHALGGNSCMCYAGLLNDCICILTTHLPTDYA